MIRLRAFMMCCIALVAACEGSDPATGPDSEEGDPVGETLPIEVLVDATDALQPPQSPVGSVPVAVAFFMTVPIMSPRTPISPAVLADRLARLVDDTNDILAQCALHLAVEVAQVIEVPPHLARVQGNERGSWGGHPPDSLGDPDLFMYGTNERLTSDARELFAHGKQHTSPNAIGVFLVEDIEYWIGEQLTPAGGLSFPPVAYHQPEDYPLRNSVLVRPSGGDPAGFPLASARVVAHELAHMLLNTGDHVAQGATTIGDEYYNLMTNGALLTLEQCDRMRANRERLFGDEAVPDPGPPDVGEP